MASLKMPPSEDVLRQFLLGQLPPDELETIGRYLESHPGALSTLPALKTGDTLLEALRSATGTSLPDSPELAALITRFEGLTVAPSGDALTPSADGEMTISSPDAGETGDPHADLTGLLAPAEQPGELGRLAEYRVIRVLGRGGMGAVFEAEDTKLGRRVALKVMLPGLAANAIAKQRFVKEAKTAAKVEHDHIVPIYQIGEFRGAPFLAMPLLAGEALDTRQKNHEPLPTEDVLRIGRQVAEGLAAAHAAGLIHRDIKPSNIWLECHANGKFKRVRILDFGLARLTTDREALTHTGAILGTPAYMAPEQARGIAVDSRADLFSLGCVLYQLATGRRPFKGDDTFSILTALATETPTPPIDVNASVPPALSALIVRLLSKDPAGRPQTAHEVAEELDRIGKVPVDATGEWTAKPKVELAPPLRKKRRKLLVAAGVLFLALAAVAATNSKTIVRVVNNEGELVVEVEDPNVEVVVKGTMVEILDEGKRYLVAAGKDGEIEIREKGSDSVLVVEKFKVARGGKTKVTVTSEKLAAARPKAVEGAVDWDRRAAEALLPFTDRMDLKLPDGSIVAAKSGTPLPSGKFKVLRLDFTNADRAADFTGKTVIPALSQLDSLEFIGGFITFSADDLERLSTMPSGRSLRLLWIALDLTKPILASLKKFPNLDAVGFMASGVDDEKLLLLNDLPKTINRLSLVNLGLQAKIGKKGFATITSLPLKELGLNYCRCLDLEFSREIAKMPSLTLLTAPVSGVGGVQLKELAASKSLTDLEFYGNPIDDAALESLKGMQTLKGLVLLENPVTEAGVKKLGDDLPKLRVVWNGGAIGPKNDSVSSRFKTSDGIEFVLVPKGKSWLGGGGGTPGAKEVVMPNDFFMGVYPITQEQWQAVMGNNPSFFRRDGQGKDWVKTFSDADLKRFPVESLSFSAVEDFLVKLNQRDKQEGWVYRLPTGEEWEYACRGGPLADRSESAFHYYLDKPSNDMRPDQAHYGYKGVPQRTCKVGDFQSNKLGIYDMHGLVLEWCSDSKVEAGKPYRMMRGGSWNDFPGAAAGALWFNPTDQYPSLGVRVVRVRVESADPPIKTVDLLEEIAARLPKGDAPPPENLFPGKVVARFTFDDATTKSSPFIDEERKTGRWITKDGISRFDAIRTSDPQMPASTRPLIPGGRFTADHAFLVRMKPNLCTWTMSFDHRQQGGVRKHLSLSVDAKGSWKLRRFGGDEVPSTPDLPAQKTPEQILAPDEWVNLTVRVSGPRVTIWAGNRIIADVPDTGLANYGEPASYSTEGHYGCIFFTVQQTAMAVPRLEFDHLTGWNLPAIESKKK